MESTVFFPCDGTSAASGLLLLYFSDYCQKSMRDTYTHRKIKKLNKKQTNIKNKIPKTLKIYKALTKAFHVFGIAQISHLILVSFALEKMK